MSSSESMTRLSAEAALGPLSELERRNAPDFLEYVGDRTLLGRFPKVSVVGARKASEDGIRRARRLCRILVEHGSVIVSGLALGIDTEAHQTAIAEGGATIAVLGSPLDNIHPASNRTLFDTIARKHLAVSQFASGHPILRTNFPRRNRTMALLSDASVIVEASDGSGSLSQGWEALRLGRPLFLMRSVVERVGLTWPEEMLSYGARVLAAPEDVFEILPTSSSDGLASAAF